MTELERLHLGTSDLDRYNRVDGDDVDAHDEEEASQANNWSTQNMEDSGYSTRKCEDSTVYFWPVKYNNGELNVVASNVFEAKTVLWRVTTSQS